MSKPTDQELDVSVANMLRLGVSLAALIVFAGGVLLLRSGGVTRSYFTFHAGGPTLRTISGIFRGARHLEPESVIQLGLLALIATPVARVALCVIGFSRQGKHLYVVVSLLVLAVLLFSLTSSGL